MVSSDENGNFFISLQTLGTTTTPAVGFSVPVMLVILTLILE
jgi:hypothetical protein